MNLQRIYERRLARPLVFLFVLLLSSAAHADDGIVTLPPGEDAIAQMDKGDPAPFDGQLFSTDTAMRWGFWLQQYKLKLKADVERERRLSRIKLDYKNTELRIQREHAAAVIRDLQDRLLKTEKRAIEAEDDARNPSFFKTFQWGLIVGLVVTGATTALILWGIGQKEG
jgi:hypothetical protein